MSFSTASLCDEATAERDVLRSITELLQRHPEAPSRETVLRDVRKHRVGGACLIGKTYHVTDRDFESYLVSRIRPVDATATLTPDIRDWVNRVVASAPELSPAQAAAAARLIVGGASA